MPSVWAWTQPNQTSVAAPAAIAIDFIASSSVEAEASISTGSAPTRGRILLRCYRETSTGRGAKLTRRVSTIRFSVAAPSTIS